MKLENIIKLGDVVILRNGEECIIGKIHIALIESHYDEGDFINGFPCKDGSQYDIIKVLRPAYNVIFDIEEEKNVCKNR